MKAIVVAALGTLISAGALLDGAVAAEPAPFESHAAHR
jgi:hypothetical protein